MQKEQKREVYATITPTPYFSVISQFARLCRQKNLI